MLQRREIQANPLETVALDRAESQGSRDNLWTMTLKSGRDQRVYVLTADDLRLLGEQIFKRVAS